VVTFTSSDTKVVKISGSTATIVGIGTATITASVAAKGNYAFASTAKSITVSAAIPSVIFTQPKSPVSYVAAKTFKLSTTSTSRGSITYTSSNTGVISVFGNMATVVGVGNVTITANIAATGNFTSATASRSVTVTP
jgi:hypothetical protein